MPRAFLAICLFLFGVGSYACEGKLKGILGEYTLGSLNSGQYNVLQLGPALDPFSVTFELHASRVFDWPKNDAAPNQGDFQGRLEFRGCLGLAVASDDAHTPDCYLVVQVVSNRAIRIERFGNCYFGNGAAPEGLYRRKARASKDGT